jgi:diadenosine tetraphosphate (Ap4A) HIT family hydrolase
MAELTPQTCKLCRFVLLTSGDDTHVDPADIQPVAVAEDDHWIVSLNESQATLGRVYFVSKRHETDVSALTDDETASLWYWVRRTKRALDCLFEPDHYNYMFLMNAVPHAHFHIYPRYQDARTFAGVEFVDSRWGGHYDPSEERRLDADVQASIADALRQALAE